jgi:glycosyltransferase involved in cell wall biosynthesis
MNNHFKIVIPVYNAEEYVARCLYSIWAQTHTNWSIVIVDDNSSDGTVSEIVRFLDKFENVKDKIEVIHNDKRYHALANILTGTSMASDHDIICHIDGDDWLCDMDALTLINEQYNHPTTDVGAVWTNQRWGFTISGNSLPMPQGVNVYNHEWVSSHLKTFRKFLINDIDMENFYDPNGKFFQRIADQAIYLPVLKRCQDLEMTYAYLPICAYHYNVDHAEIDFDSDDSQLQHSEAAFLRKRGFLE